MNSAGAQALLPEAGAEPAAASGDDVRPQPARRPPIHPDDIDADPAAPLRDLPGHSSRGRLERVLRRGEFAVTAELSPPDSADADDVYARVAHFEGYVDAINATDGSGANCHMSSVAVCALLTRMGYSPVMQISCRDHNRIAIQGAILGAAALRVPSILCLTGDGVGGGDHPQAKPVFDLDSIQLLAMARAMRDEARFLSGRAITTPPRIFLGAAENPFAPPFDLRPLRLAKKIAAGAQFIQTQYCFDVPLFERFMARVRDLGLDRACFILVGIGPLKSARAARWMRAKVAGVHIPDHVVERLERAADPQREGLTIAIEIIEQVRAIKGVAGIHVMAYRQEECVPALIEGAGLLRERTPWSRAAAHAAPLSSASTTSTPVATGPLTLASKDPP